MDSDVVEMAQVVFLSILVPGDVGELLKVSKICIGKVAVYKHLGDESILWDVGCVELLRMNVEPVVNLLLLRFLVKVRWRAQSAAHAAHGWMLGVGYWLWCGDGVRVGRSGVFRIDVEGVGCGAGGVEQGSGETAGGNQSSHVPTTASEMTL